MTRGTGLTALFMCGALGTIDCGQSPREVQQTSTGGVFTTSGSTGASSNGGAAGSSSSAGTSGTGGFAGPACQSDADCNDGQAGTDTVCGAAGVCVVGCHASSDCSLGDTCANPSPDGACRSPEDAGVEVGATDAMLAVASSIQVSGAGSDEIGAIRIAGNVGTIEFQGVAMPAVAYEVQPFGAQTLYQVLALQPGALGIFWIYCRAGQIDELYREDTGGVAVTYETGTGTCSDNGTPVSVSVSLPAFALTPPPGIVPGISMQGNDISYDGGAPGTVTIAGTTWTLYPFNTVDCSACGTPGWFEVHSLLWDPAAAQAGFGIFYLESGSTGSIALDYSLVLPTLASVNTTLSATWSHP